MGVAKSFRDGQGRGDPSLIQPRIIVYRLPRYTHRWGLRLMHGILSDKRQERR